MPYQDWGLSPSSYPDSNNEDSDDTEYAPVYTPPPGALPGNADGSIGSGAGLTQEQINLREDEASNYEVSRDPLIGSDQIPGIVIGGSISLIDATAQTAGVVTSDIYVRGSKGIVTSSQQAIEGMIDGELSQEDLFDTLVSGAAELPKKTAVGAAVGALGEIVTKSASGEEIDVVTAAKIGGVAAAGVMAGWAASIIVVALGPIGIGTAVVAAGANFLVGFIASRAVARELEVSHLIGFDSLDDGSSDFTQTTRMAYADNGDGTRSFGIESFVTENSQGSESTPSPEENDNPKLSSASLSIDFVFDEIAEITALHEVESGNVTLSEDESSGVVGDERNNIIDASGIVAAILIDAGDGNDAVSGGTGDDYVRGGNGDDDLKGDNGNDTLSGGGGNDQLDGGIGNDVLSGGDGNDTLLGGAISDITDIVFTSTSQISNEFGVTAGGWSSNDLYPRDIVDIDGDGAADIVGFSDTGVYTSTNNDDGSFESGTVVLAEFGNSAGGWTSNDHVPRMVVDINGDGFADIVGFSMTGVITALNNGDGTFQSGTLVLAEFGNSVGGWNSNNYVPRTVADINGDGFADIIGFSVSGVYAAMNNGNGTFSSGTHIYNEFGISVGGWADNNQYPRHVVDINGDGFADLAGFGSTGLYVAMNNGDGTFAAGSQILNDFGTIAGGWYDIERYPRQIIDINGDGLVDVIGFGTDGVYAALNQGAGVFSDPVTKIANGFGTGTGFASSDRNPRQIVDINGDGLSDIVTFGDQGVYVTHGATPGADVLSGGAGSDTLDGGYGNDQLTGGQDADTLIGGTGSDVFVFESEFDSTSITMDVITDFSRSDDLIDLSQIDGANFNQMSFTQIGDDLQVTLNGTNFVVLLSDMQNVLSEDDFIFG